MENTTSILERKATLRSWIIVVVIAVLFLCWGVFIFIAVGDKGPPSWHFGVVEDIPGQSPYSSQSTEPITQHVSD